MSGSDIARFRQSQAEQEQAAHNGLYGSAIVASHESITARINAGGATLLSMFEEGLEDEAFALWNAGILEINPTKG